MGTVSEGSLKCMYHGWSFGKDGQCDDVPTMPGQVSALFQSLLSVPTHFS